MNTQRATPITVNRLLGAMAGILLMFTLLLTIEFVKDTSPSPSSKSSRSTVSNGSVQTLDEQFSEKGAKPKKLNRKKPISSKVEKNQIQQ